MISAPTFFEALSKVFKVWSKYQASDSLVRYTANTRVEPIMMVDRRVQQLPYMSDVAQSMLSLVAALYLQAASMRVNIGKINVGKFLGPLNPDRPIYSAETINPAVECLFGTRRLNSYIYGLNAANPTPSLHPAVESLMTSFESALAVATGAGNLATLGSGAAGDAAVNAGKALMAGMKGSEGGKGGSSFGISTDLNKDIKESANLSVGRLYTVEIQDSGHRGSIPVMIRLLAAIVESPLLVHILSDNSKYLKTSAKERWYAWRSGQLKFWRDLVFATDLIDEHRQALLADSNGVYSNILARRRNNATAAALTQEPSVGTASSLVVASRQTIRELEKDIGGKWDNPHIRNKVFESTMLMIVAVIDADADMITFYHRGIDQPSELSVRDVKQASKGAGPDISQILSMFMMGKAPVF